MQAYQVKSETGIDPVTRTKYLSLDHNRPVDGDTTDMSKVVILTTDHKFAHYQDHTYRVCQVELEDTQDTFIKIWIVDPFAGYTDYEQLPLPLDDYCI